MKALSKKSILLLILLITFTIQAQIQTDTIIETRVFELGEVFINSQSTKSNITALELQQYNKTDVAQSLNILPSIVINLTGSRNESAVFLRGFDIRSVPIYADGIPIYVPYDGYVDLARFTSADLSKIEVSKGYSSILYGPNAMGGTINMISTKPESAFELKTKMGLLSGDGFNNFVSIGTKQNKFYLQGVFSQFDKQFMPLSTYFDPNQNETDEKRDNSYRNDRKFTAKIGYTPNEKDAYTLSYIKQNGEKGNPIYLGNDPNIRLRYWQWPYWKKESLYFISKTQILPKTYVKSRFFIDHFKNKLTAFDNAQYNSQTKPSSFTSYYHDQTYGAHIETGTDFEKHVLKSSLQFKRDNHRQNNEGKKQEKMEDVLYSFGVEDIFTGLKDFKFIVGASYNYRNSLHADNANIINTDGSFASFPTNSNASFNAQFFTQYTVNQNFNLDFTTSYKTRFATMKDRYSYRSGTSLANPNLDSEAALNFELGSTLLIKSKFQLIPELFYSHIFNTIQLIDNVQDGLSQVQNTGKSQFYGGDISLSYQATPTLTTLLNYTFIQRKNLTNPNLLFTDVPENHLFAAIDWKPYKPIQLNLNTEYSSKRNSTSYGTQTAAYFVFNTQASYQFKNGLRLETGINNIFDKYYSITEGFPEQGRNYYGSLYYNFNTK